MTQCSPMNLARFTWGTVFRWKKLSWVSMQTVNDAKRDLVHSTCFSGLKRRNFYLVIWTIQLIFIIHHPSHDVGWSGWFHHRWRIFFTNIQQTWFVGRRFFLKRFWRFLLRPFPPIITVQWKIDHPEGNDRLGRNPFSMWRRVPNWELTAQSSRSQLAENLKMMISYHLGLLLLGSWWPKKLVSSSSHRTQGPQTRNSSTYEWCDSSARNVGSWGSETTSPWWEKIDSNKMVICHNNRWMQSARLCNECPLSKHQFEQVDEIYPFFQTPKKGDV